MFSDRVKKFFVFYMPVIFSVMALEVEIQACMSCKFYLASSN